MHTYVQTLWVCVSKCMICASVHYYCYIVMLKGNDTRACIFIALNKYVLSLSSAYQACVLCIDFRLLKMQTDIAKESSTTGYKYVYREIYPQTNFRCEPSLNIDSM